MIEYGLRYTQSDGVRICRFTYADWVGNSVDRKSTLGCYFSVGTRVVSWFSRKQKSVEMNSAEEEYMAASTGMCKAIWIGKLLVSLFSQRMEATNI